MSNFKDSQTKNGPLLYIVQPGIQQATGKMQQSFVVRKNKKVSSFDYDGVEIVERAGNEEDFLQEQDTAPSLSRPSYEPQMEDYVDEYVEDEDFSPPKITEAGIDLPVEEKGENRIVTGVRKPFKDMTLDEKIYFLTHRPAYIPKAPCEVKTTQQSYFGNVEKLEGSKLHIRSLNDTGVSVVDKESIISIRMLGI